MSLATLFLITVGSLVAAAVAIAYGLGRR